MDKAIPDATCLYTWLHPWHPDVSSHGYMQVSTQVSTHAYAHVNTLGNARVYAHVYAHVYTHVGALDDIWHGEASDDLRYQPTHLQIMCSWPSLPGFVAIPDWRLWCLCRFQSRICGHPRLVFVVIPDRYSICSRPDRPIFVIWTSIYHSPLL